MPVFRRKSAIALTLMVCAAVARRGTAQDVSAPAILQMYEARWDTINDRMADIFQVGYGRMWLPPAARGGSGFSVGYDVFDRFDLGGPRNETHYGTSTGFKTLVKTAHQAGVLVNPDLIWNHNGVGNRNDANFVSLGGYPGFALTLPGDINGDFNDPFVDALSDDEIVGQLAGLNDIAQEKNYQFIRHPTTPEDPNNIPSGTMYNIPDPNNARYYPDIDQGGNTVFDPALGVNVTLYDFNASNPLAGDPVQENALGLLMRNVRWMIQEYDVDGFRLDAARHFPRWVLDYFDQSSFLAKTTPLLDGSPQHVYSFIETGGDNAANLQGFIRKNIDNGNLGSVGGNRDVLDFNLFYALRDNLTGNGLANNWHSVIGASIDLNDDGLRNGSQGVSFVQSHDETGAFLGNVAHAYTLMMPGNALVYLNAEEYGPTGTFPQPGKDDALGGFYGETITRLVEVRNSHGRGNFQERWIDEAFGDVNGNDTQESNVYIYERLNSAIVGLNSRNDAFVETRNGVQTGFAPGTILVELTGNAADPTVDPGGVIPDAIRVNGSGQVDISIPANDGHGRGYVIYGPAAPVGTLTLSNVASTLAGATPSVEENGTARLADIQVIHADSFSVHLSTSPVSVPDPANPGSTVRDFQADGDNALLKIDGGIDVNSQAGVDYVTPGSSAYGFEEFTDTRVPGFVDDGNGGNIGSGTGTYIQSIDATQLAEGRHFITTRIFRHRDGGPEIFEDIKQTIYIDRLPPEAEVVSFEPFATSPDELENRDLIVRSVDKTADNMHVFLDLPAGLSDAEVLQLALDGQNDAGNYDSDSWIFGFNADTMGNGLGVTTGNHVATVVTFEPTFDGTLGFNVQRFAGLFTNTGVGTGFGDLDHDNLLEPDDLSGPGGFEQVLESNNSEFNAAADLTGDGLIDNRDLFDLVTELTTGAAPTNVLAELEQVLLRRADLDGSGVTDTDDLVLLYANLGAGAGDFDLNVDGLTDATDVETFIEQLVRTVPGDFNLDGQVSAADYTLWRDNLGANNGLGDANFDGVANSTDYGVWKSAFGFARSPLASIPAALSATVPEPSSVSLALWMAVLLMLSAALRRWLLDHSYLYAMTSASLVRRYSR